MYTVEGKNFIITNETVGTDWFEVDPTRRFYSVFVKARSSAVTLSLKRVDTDTAYLTIPAGEALSLHVAMDADNHFYLKSDTAGTIVELLWTE